MPISGDIGIGEGLGPGYVVVGADVPGLGEDNGGHCADVAGVDHADTRLAGVGVKGPGRVDGGDHRRGDCVLTASRSRLSADTLIG